MTAGAKARIFGNADAALKRRPSTIRKTHLELAEMSKDLASVWLLVPWKDPGVGSARGDWKPGLNSAGGDVKEPGFSRALRSK
jgi:hypothetical protein